MVDPLSSAQPQRKDLVARSRKENLVRDSPLWCVINPVWFASIIFDHCGIVSSIPWSSVVLDFKSEKERTRTWRISIYTISCSWLLIYWCLIYCCFDRLGMIFLDLIIALIFFWLINISEPQGGRTVVKGPVEHLQTVWRWLEWVLSVEYKDSDYV